MASMQQVIQGLSTFWDDQGCAVLPPCAFPVPLGLLHPYVFFRLLEPDPWMAAFLQPIHRPTDGRRGSHPYRAARHLQFQVVWKEPPSTAPQEAFVAGLEAVGLDTGAHDLRWRFGHLDVAAVGVSGQGWQVELDGLEIGRINFLHRLAGRPAEPAAVELAYGIDRLALFLGRHPDLYQVPWHGAIDQPDPAPVREKRREREQELYRYADEVAGVGYLRQVLDQTDREAERCLAAELPRAAYELAVQALPALDHLEARGALASGERRQWLDGIARRVLAAADLYRRLYDLDPDLQAPAANPGPTVDPNPAQEADGPTGSKAEEETADA